MTNPFDWKGKPSIIANDRAFKAMNGKSQSQHSIEALQKVYAKGINTGSIHNTDPKTFEQVHRRKK